MFNKITISIFLVAAIVYAALKYANATDHQAVDFVGGFLVGMAISIIGTGISKLLRKKKKESPQEEKNEEELS